MSAQDRGLLPTLRGLLGVSLGVSCFGLANGGNFAVYAVEISAAGGGEGLVGLSTSIYFLGTLTASLTFAPLVSRLGHVRAFALFATLAFGSTAALAFVPWVQAWPALRCVTGLGIGGFYLVMESWFNYAAENRHRGRVYAFYETVRLSSVAIGSALLLGLNQAFGASVFLATAALYLAALLPVGMSHARQPRPETTGAMPVTTLLRLAPLGMACCFVGGLTTAAIYGLVPLYGEQAGLDTGWLAALVFVSHFGAFVLQIPMGALSDRLGRRPAILLVSALCSVLALATGLADNLDLPLLLLAGMLVGGVCHTVYMLGTVITNDRLDPASLVRGAAVLLVAYDVGTVIGPYPAALAMQAFGRGGLYLFIAGLMFALALLAAVPIATIRRSNPERCRVPCPNCPPGA